MKVYIDTLVFGLQKMGGVSVYWYEIIRRMLKDDSVDLTLLKIPGEYVNQSFAGLDTSKAAMIEERKNNLQVLRNRKPAIGKVEEPIIFHSTYLRTCPQKNVKNVVTIHDFTHQIYFHGVKKYLNSFQKWRSVRNADCIICVSENTKKDLLHYYPRLDESRVKVVYHGAGDAYYYNPKLKLDKKYDKLEGKKYFIYVGDRYRYKNFSFLLNVLERDSSVLCVLVGGADFSDWEAEKIKKLGNRVIRYTGVPDRELNVLYNNAYCLIYPSLYEGFGIPVLEAMKAGCPVIAFRNSSIPEVLRGSGILLENNDIDGCMAAMKQLSEKEYRNRIISEQMKSAEYFSWDKAYGELIEIYKQMFWGGMA